VTSVRLLALGLAAVAIGVCSVSMAGAAATTPRRQSNTGGIAVAGASVYAVSTHVRFVQGNSCTLAFGVRDAARQPAALTAGHCVANGGQRPTFDVYQTHALSGDRTVPGEGLATIKAGDYHVGKKGDNALATLDRGRSNEARVFVGGTDSETTIPVARLLDPTVGMSQLCYSGERSGEHCGFTVSRAGRNEPFVIDGKRVTIGDEWRMRGPCAAKPGDSGSPIYQKIGHTADAVGILSGGGKDVVTRHGRSTTRCFVDFTPLSLALSDYHATLLVTR
jgi:hypothetical protein